MQKLCGFLSARSTYNSLSIIKIVTPDGLPQHQRVHEAFQIYQVPSRFEVIQPSAKVYILHFTLNYNSVTHEKCVPRLVRAYMYIKDQYTLLGLGLIYFHCVTGGGNKQYLLKTHFFLGFWSRPFRPDLLACSPQGRLSSRVSILPSEGARAPFSRSIVYCK